MLYICLVTYGLWVGIQSAGELVHSAEEDNLSPLHSKIACLCQSIEINNKHVYRQSQVRKPIGSEVKWAECSLTRGTGCYCPITLQIAMQWHLD